MKSPYTLLSVFVDTISGKHGIRFFEGLMIQARLVDCDDTYSDLAVGTFSLQKGEKFLGLVNCNHKIGVRRIN